MTFALEPKGLTTTATSTLSSFQKQKSASMEIPTQQLHHHPSTASIKIRNSRDPPERRNDPREFPHKAVGNNSPTTTMSTSNSNNSTTTDSSSTMMERKNLKSSVHIHPGGNDDINNNVSRMTLPTQSSLSEKQRNGTTSSNMTASHAGSVITVSSRCDVIPNSQERVCDHGKDPTVLYSFLEESDWKMAMARCETHPDEVRTWISRRDLASSSPQTQEWIVLPIHAAIMFRAPLVVIEVLIEKYPAALARKDYQGMVPLHLAFMQHGQKLNKNDHARNEHDCNSNSQNIDKNEDLITLLLTRYPKAIHMQENHARTPMELASTQVTFSAALLRRYVNASVALASSNSTIPTATKTTASALERQEESTTVKSPSFEATKDYGSRLLTIKEDYVLQIKRLSEVYENRLAVIDVKYKEHIQSLQEVARMERQELVDQHHEEMKCIHEVVDSTHAQQVSDWEQKMTKERETLQSSVQQYKNLAEQLADQVATQSTALEKVKDQITLIAQDHEKLLSVVERQQHELEAANSMRLQMLRALWQHEEEHKMKGDGAGDQDVILKLFQTTKLRIENVGLELKQVSINPTVKSGSSSRSNAGGGSNQEELKHPMASAAVVVSKAPQDPEETVERDSTFHDVQQDDYEEYAQVDPVLDDDISAMTGDD